MLTVTMFKAQIHYLWLRRLASNSERNEWRWTYQFLVTVLGAAIIIVLDLAVIIFLTDFRVSTLAVGITTFFGVLTLSNLLSRSLELDKGEVRNALAISIVVVYFSVLGLAFSGEIPDTDNSVIIHFSNIVGVVVAFYFGSRALESWAKAKFQR